MAFTPDYASPHYRCVWISDLHLGFPGCQAEAIVAFLKSIRCDRLYLVGDVLDMWYMQRGQDWPQAHNDVIRALLTKARRGTRIIYVAGNHDDLLRDHCGTAFGNIRVVNRMIHTTRDGRRFLVLHGDQFDSMVRCGRFLSVAGTRAYGALVRLNRGVTALRRRLGLPQWSLAGFLRGHVQGAVHYLTRFEDAARRAAREADADGVICGHVHRAGINTRDGITYCNSGDWVDSCTALVEAPDGRIELLRWPEAATTSAPLSGDRQAA